MERELLILAGTEEELSPAGGKDGEREAEDPPARAGVDTDVSKGTSCKIKGSYCLL